MNKEILYKGFQRLIESIKEIINSIKDLIRYVAKLLVAQENLPYSYKTYHFVMNECRKYHYQPYFKKNMPYCRRCY